MPTVVQEKAKKPAWKQRLLGWHFAFTYRILRLTNLFFRVKRFAMPDAETKIQGGALVIANHTSLADPMISANALHCRAMRFLAAENVMGKPLIGLLLRASGCIKIDRRICDLEAIKHAVQVLQQGYALTVYPEGGIQRQDALGGFKSGMILIALRAKVPIIPIYIHKPKHFWQRRHVMIGKKFVLNGLIPTAQKMEEMARQLQEYETELQAALLQREKEIC